MEGQRDLEMSLNFGRNANNVSYQPEDDPNQHYVVSAKRSGNQRAPRNYVEFLAESSTFLENASGADMLESISSPAGGSQSVGGLSEIQREYLFNNLGKACDYKPADPSLDLNAWQNPHTEVQPANRFTNSQQQVLPQQSHTSWTQELYEDNRNMSQVPPRVTVAPSLFLAKPRYSVPKQRAATTDRQRRIKIAERLRSLQELLPHPAEGCSQAITLDYIIDHLKFLQLQIKELSQRRLGGQPTSKPFIFLEGYGHYIISEQMTNEPLEEMMGKLLESPAAATRLLESKGLYMRPMSWAEGSGQPS